MPHLLPHPIYTNQFCLFPSRSASFHISLLYAAICVKKYNQMIKALFSHFFNLLPKNYDKEFIGGQQVRDALLKLLGQNDALMGAKLKVIIFGLLCQVEPIVFNTSRITLNLFILLQRHKDLQKPFITT